MGGRFAPPPRGARSTEPFEAKQDEWLVGYKPGKKEQVFDALKRRGYEVIDYPEGNLFICKKFINKGELVAMVADVVPAATVEETRKDLEGTARIESGEGIVFFEPNYVASIPPKPPIRPAEPNAPGTGSGAGVLPPPAGPGTSPVAMPAAAAVAGGPKDCGPDDVFFKQGKQWGSPIAGSIRPGVNGKPRRRKSSSPSSTRGSISGITTW